MLEKESIFIFNTAIKFGGNYLKKIIGKKSMKTYRSKDVYDRTIFNSKILIMT